MVVLAYVLRVGQFDDKSNNYNYKLDFDRVAYLAYMWQNTYRLLINIISSGIIGKLGRPGKSAPG